MSSLDSLKIVSIGGGANTGELLELGIDLVGKESKKKALVVPTARPNPEGVPNTYKIFGDFYQDRGIETALMHDFWSFPDDTRQQEMLDEADILYVSGGDTATMMRVWEYFGFTDNLRHYIMAGKVITGISAGAIAPFRWGHSDSNSYPEPKNKHWSFIPVASLGIINAGITPHYNTTPEGKITSREDDFHRMFKELGENFGTRFGFGIDNDAALVINDGKITPATSSPNCGVSLISVDNNGQLEKHRLGEDAGIIDLAGI
jgi:peptidase E